MQFKSKAVVLCITAMTLLIPPSVPVHADANKPANATQATQIKQEKPVTFKSKTNLKPKLTCLGTFKITSYNYDEGGGENYRTASGRTPEPYYTIAVDPSVIPLGTKVYISGLGWCRADDTGGAINGNIIDYHIGYDNCDSFGIQYHKVYVAQ